MNTQLKSSLTDKLFVGSISILVLSPVCTVKVFEFVLDKILKPVFKGVRRL